MKVKLFATLRPLVGAREVDVSAGPGDPVGKVLAELVEKYPALKDEIFHENGSLQDRVHVFLNGRDVRYLDGLDTVVKEGDELRIFPPVGGGR